jgi:hypothetical protein
VAQVPRLAAVDHHDPKPDVESGAKSEIFLKKARARNFQMDFKIVHNGFGLFTFFDPSP